MSPDSKGPRVSIILPACTSADGLPATIESILNQTYPDFELIVVDDGSTDSTREVLALWTDQRVVILSNPEKCGVARACNAGIGAARGELIGFISSGDEWDRTKLEEQVSAFSFLPGEYGVVYSDVWEITPAGTRAYWHSPEISGPDLFNPTMTCYQAGCLGTGSLLVRRAFLDQAGPFDEQFGCYADTDLIIRVQRLCRFHHIRKPLYTSRSHQDPATNPLEKGIALLLLLQKYPEAMEEPVFRTYQMDLIRYYLCQARGMSPAAAGNVSPEPERECYRQPVPEL
jgi:glycosyltransferase involved in cell wall biosynthesis